MFFMKSEKTVMRFFETVTLTTLPGFYLFKVNNKNTKNIGAGCEMCLKLTIKKPEQRQ